MIKVTGIKEIDEVFKQMPRALTHQVMSAGAAQAAKPLVEREKLLAPEGPTGRLIDSIGVIKTTARKATELGKITVGPRRSIRYKGHYAHFLEYGTTKRELIGRGKYRAGTNRGTMSKHPFVEIAFQQTQGKMISEYNTEVGKALLRTMKRYIKN